MTEKIDPMAGTANDYSSGDWIDRLDELKINIDERQVIAHAAVNAMQRTNDRLTLDACTANDYQDCWQCSGTGFFGGVDNDHVKCTHPPDTRVRNENGALVYNHDSATWKSETDTEPTQAAKFEAALREIANLPPHELGRAYKIVRKVLGIKVGDEN